MPTPTDITGNIQAVNKGGALTRDAVLHAVPSRAEEPASRPPASGLFVPCVYLLLAATAVAQLIVIVVLDLS